MNVHKETARSYALKLYAMAPADREWVMARLDAPIKEELGALIAEIASLGFQVDQHVLDSIRERDAAGSASLAVDEEAYARNIRLLDRADPGWINGVLKLEPPMVRAMLESVHAWSWLPARDGLTGKPAGSAVRNGPSFRVRSTLIAAFAKRMRDDDAEGMAPVFAPLNTPATDERKSGYGWFRWRR